MARTTITPNTIDIDGTSPTQTTGIADGHQFTNNGRIIARAYNADAGSHDITFVTGGTADGVAIADVTVSVGATATKYIGPFPIGTWNAADKMVDIDYEAGEHDHFTVELIDTTL